MQRRLQTGAIVYVKRFLARAFARTKGQDNMALPPEEELDPNPYIPQIREVMEQVLKSRRISYGQFAPVVIDGGDAEKTLLAAELLAQDLNKLTLLTDRPAYFEEYTDNMYEEQGLIVELLPKDADKIAGLATDAMQGNVILDFEEPEERSVNIKFGKKVYIPIYKKRWESAGNLDIAVPIGYNTLIVRVSETAKKQPFLDKFERAFYENE